MIAERLAELLAADQFSLTHARKRERLLPLLAERARAAAQAHPGLDRYFTQLGLSVNGAEDYHDLPYLPVGLFKTQDLATVPADDVVRTLLSSATTTGTPSRIPLNKTTSKMQVRGLAAILKDVLGGHRRPFLVLDIPEINQPGAQLTARGAAARGIMPFASETVYGLKKDGDGFALDLEAMADFFARHEGQEVLVFGFTYIVWTEVVRRLREAGRTFNHPSMTVLHSGGWKKLTAEKVDREVFGAGVSEVLGCPSEQVRDFYGMVEQVGVVFVDCEAGHKHSPAFAEVAIRDFDTLRQVGVGETGLIQVMSLLPDSYPGFALLTEDVGEVLGFDDCPCGRKGMHFRFRSRVENVEVRGCGDTVAADRLVAMSPAAPVATGPVSGTITPLAGVNPAEDGLAGLAGLNDVEPLPLDTVLGLLDDAAARLLQPKMAGIEGLAFLSAWLKRNNLQRVLETNFGPRQEALLGPIPDGGSALRAVPRGLVGHWVAGNVPTLALFSWALATLAGNASVVRVSRASVDEARLLFHAVAEARYGNATGADLLRRSSILHFESAHQGWNEELSRLCDARCIWGGAEAVDAVRRLPVREHTEDLVFGPKFSLAVVDAAALEDPDEARRLAKVLAREISVFEQGACSSPQVLVLEGDLETRSGWLDTLHEALAEQQIQNPRRGVAETRAAAIIRERAAFGFAEDAGVRASRGTEHSLLIAPGLDLPEALQGRTLHVRLVDDLNTVPGILGPKIQTIGLGVTDTAKRDAFAEAAARRGVSRIVPLGTMNFFETPWDGMLPVNRLVRWVRLPLKGEG